VRIDTGGVPGVVDGVKLFRGAGRASRRERQQIADPE